MISDVTISDRHMLFLPPGIYIYAHLFSMISSPYLAKDSAKQSGATFSTIIEAFIAQAGAMLQEDVENNISMVHTDSIPVPCTVNYYIKQYYTRCLCKMTEIQHLLGCSRGRGCCLRL